MVSRKRAREEMEVEEPAQEPSVLSRLQNMWHFANLAQYIALFGDVLKIDREIDIEALENECLRPQPSEKLAQIGLALLKHVSSFKGLTLDIFDEYTRRQYLVRAPQRNPFGTDETPNKFDDFDVFTKIRVLQQLSVWTLSNPNTIRERLNVSENEQTSWRIEPLGWDSRERTLFVLDDNRLYRQTDPPPPAPKPKSKPKPKKSRGTRSNKRRKYSVAEPEDIVDEEEETMVQDTVDEDDGLGGCTWECLCVTLEDYQNYMNGIRKSRDPDEKILYQRLQNDVIPAIESAAEERARKQAQEERKRETELKLATAKRSSRISAKLEKQKVSEAAEEAERKRQAELAMAKAEQEKQRRREEERDSRMMTREQRLREREAKRILHEEELRKLEENSEKLDAAEGRMSERHLKAEMKRRQEELQKLNEEEEWVFDCEVCGLYGENLDDGSHSIACEKCNVWQHSKCHGITKAQAERDDFHFTCKTCIRKMEDAKQPKLPPLKFRLTSASPSSAQTNGGAPVLSRKLEAVQIPVQRPVAAAAVSRPIQNVPQLMNGPSLSPQGQAVGPPGIQRSEAAYGIPFPNINGTSPPQAVQPHSVSQMRNNYVTSSPPPPYPSSPRRPSATFAQTNGSPFSGQNPFKSAHNPPQSTNFSRPASSAGPPLPYQSPVKHSSAPSPRPANGIPNTYSFTNSPHSSFPPSSNQRPSFSPTKNSSPPPPPLSHIMSSPATAMPPIAPSPSQMPAQMLPSPIPAPEKHDGVRPVSSHNVSETPILPPIKSLSPSAKPQILSPPTKKLSPTPERLQFAPVSGNGYGDMQ